MPIPVPVRRSLLVLAAYGAALFICLLVLTWVLRLWRADLAVPFSYSADTLLAQMWIKGMAEHGWYLNNPSVGLPGGLRMEDYPMADNLHFAAMKLLLLRGFAPVNAYNLYFLLTFPLTTLTSLFVLRRFQVAYGPALVASLLFTFLPYHFLRGEGHLFLAAYYLVPLMILVILRVYLGETPFLRAGTGSERPRLDLCTLRSLVTALICLLTASAGVYYAFFACYFLMVAGVVAAVRRGRLYPFVASALAVVLVGAGVLANLSPTFLYRLRHGSSDSAVMRAPADAEEFGMKLSQLLFPISGHRLAPLLKFKARYNAPPTPLVNENDWSSLGIVGAAGFLAMMARLFYRRPAAFRRPLPDALSVLGIAAVLLATVGGLGTVFSFLISCWIRAYNRISVYIAFFALFTVALLLEAAYRRYVHSRRGAVLYAGLLGGLVLLGVLDQTSDAFVPAYAEQKERYAQDAEFVSQVEAAVPPGGMIFQLPYLAFPESPPLHGMSVYEPFRAYLHSKTLRWSHGAVRGREADLWQQQVVTRPVEQMVESLSFAGFAGIYLDRFGYADKGVEIQSRLSRLLGSPALVSANARFVFFDMAAYNRRLHEGYQPEQWQARHEAALHPVLVSWQGGCSLAETRAAGDGHWCYSFGKLNLINSSERVKVVTLDMTFKTEAPGPSQVFIEGPLFAEQVPVGEHGNRLTRTVTIPPGKHPVRLRGETGTAGDTQGLAFKVESIAVNETD